MPKNWVGNTSGVTTALTELNSAYQDELHEQVRASAKTQEEVVHRLRRFEKEVGGTTYQISNQLARSDYSTIHNDIAAIESALKDAHKNIEECISKCRSIEQPNKRSMWLPNKEQFPNLYEYAIQRTKPELPQRAPPQTSLHTSNTH